MLEKSVESARSQREKQTKLQLEKEVRHKVAAKEKEAISDARRHAARACASDGLRDFSARELSILVKRKSLNVMSSRTASLHLQDGNRIGLDMEDIQFISDWLNTRNLNANTGTRCLTKTVHLRSHSMIHVTR